MKVKYPLTRYPVNARTYRRVEDGWENLEAVQKQRQSEYILRMGQYTPKQEALVIDLSTKEISNASGRVWWAAGSNKEDDPYAFPAFYNCSGILFKNYYDFIRPFTNLFLGCGQGEVILNDWSRFEKLIEPLSRYDQKLFNLPLIKNVFNLTMTGEFGKYGPQHPDYTEVTKLYVGAGVITIEIGDSREGWASAYNLLLELYTNGSYYLEDKEKKGVPTKGDINYNELNINGYELNIDISSVRPYGTPIKGFGGIANPLYLETFFRAVVNKLNSVCILQDGVLSTLDISLLLNECGALAVSGNIRRSAKINQFLYDDPTSDAKMGLYRQDEDGNWVVDTEKQALKYSNFTKMYFEKPTYEQIEGAVTSQYFSGEGAIQYVPVAIARANIDLFDNEEDAIKQVSKAYEDSTELELFKELLKRKYDLEEDTPELFKELFHRLTRFQLNPCGK